MPAVEAFDTANRDPSIHPMPESEPPTPPPAPESTGLPRHIAAGIACIFTLIGGIVFLILEKKDRFVRFYAMQSVFLGGLLLAVSILMRVMAFLFQFIPFLGKLLMLALWVLHVVFSVAWLVAYVVQIVKAFSNKEWEIPYLGPLARKQLGEAPPSP